jgi:glycosyltransferase involved in cell wall biosynthesis
MNSPPRVALFTDCFHEVNGAAHSCRQLVQYANRHNLPFLSVHGGPRTELIHQGSVINLELERGPATFPVDTDFGCDPLLWRYAKKVAKVLKDFQPDIVHVISPGDFSALGAYLGHRLGVPIIGSYHTQLHQYAATRMRRSIAFLPSLLREFVVDFVQRATLRGMTLFYKIPRLLLAPTPEICHWLGRFTGRPCRLMGRGVDTTKFDPAWRDANDGVFRLGYVGRLTIEKNVRFLAQIEQALLALGKTNYRFVIVGEGSERAWLAEHMQQAELPGVLRGDALSRAYANLDLFVFPSHTDAFGNVVQEALASGVPAVVTSDGGPKFVINDGITGFAAATDDAFIAQVVNLINTPKLRQRMAMAARAATANRTWDDVMSNVYRDYRELRESAAAEVAGQARAAGMGKFPKLKIKFLGYDGTPPTNQPS